MSALSSAAAVGVAQGADAPRVAAAREHAGAREAADAGGADFARELEGQLRPDPRGGVAELAGAPAGTPSAPDAAALAPAGRAQKPGELDLLAHQAGSAARTSSRGAGRADRDGVESDGAHRPAAASAQKRGPRATPGEPAPAERNVDLTACSVALAPQHAASLQVASQQGASQHMQSQPVKSQQAKSPHEASQQAVSQAASKQTAAKQVASTQVASQHAASAQAPQAAQAERSGAESGQRTGHVPGEAGQAETRGAALRAAAAQVDGGAQAAGSEGAAGSAPAPAGEAGADAVGPHGARVSAIGAALHQLGSTGALAQGTAAPLHAAAKGTVAAAQASSGRTARKPGLATERGTQGAGAERAAAEGQKPGAAAQASQHGAPAVQLARGAARVDTAASARATAPVLAAASADAADDPTLRLTLLPRAAHLTVTTEQAGSLSLHLRVRDGVADVRLGGEAARLFDARTPELRAALATQGLQLGSMELPAHAASAQAGMDLAQQNRQGGHGRDEADARAAAEDLPSASTRGPAATPAAPRARAGRIHLEA